MQQTSNQKDDEFQPKAKWIKADCSQCGCAVYFLEKWRVRPKLCQRCRLKKIEDLRHLFEFYLRMEDEIWAKPMPPRERQIAAKRGALIMKARNALRDSRSSDSLIETCLNDTDLSKLAIRLAKESRIKVKPNAIKILPPKILGFVQGGAPGSGKNS
jgi:hypothetical protein